MNTTPETPGDYMSYARQRADREQGTFEGSLEEILQYNARLKDIIAELLIKNQVLRWAIQGKVATDLTNNVTRLPEEAA